MAEQGETLLLLPSNAMQMIQSRDHPHYGELGWLVPDTIQPNTGQLYFKLSNCQHSVVGCYVLETDLTTPQQKAVEEKMTNMTEAIDPYKYNTKTVDKLTEAFGMSYNISEACQHAGISRETFYRWLKETPEFEGIIEEAKAKPLKRAKEVIGIALDTGDVTTAKWYAERRDPDFKPKAEIDNNLAIPETRKKIGDFLDDDGSDDGSGQPATSDGTATGDEVAEAPTDIS